MDDFSRPHLFWLNGMAGIGKTTVAKTVCELATKKGVLIASFFFSRDSDELSDHRLVLPTIARQLAYKNRVYMHHLAEALKDGSAKDIEASLAGEQFRILIAEPLARLPTSSKILLVFDALDECKNDERAGSILQILKNHRLQFPVRIFVTSRPEQHIRSVFLGNTADHANVVLHDIEKNIVQHDISLYLRHRLEQIPSNPRIREAEPLSNDWFSDSELEKLVRRCGSLFVYGVTVIRFIEDHYDCNPRQQLTDVLSARADSETVTNQHRNLDELYMEVLQSAIKSKSKGSIPKAPVQRIRAILGTVISLVDPICLDALQLLLGYVLSPAAPLKVGAIRDTLRDLHSIIIVPLASDPLPNAPLRFFHPSFPDFLTNKGRCGDERFQVNHPDIDFETRICLWCLETICANLEYNVLEFEQVVWKNDNIPDLAQRIDKKLLREGALQYACRYWAVHLLNSRKDEVTIIEKLKTFVHNHLLQWLEVMSWLKLTSATVSLLKKVHTWTVRLIESFG